MHLGPAHPFIPSTAGVVILLGPTLPQTTNLPSNADDTQREYDICDPKKSFGCYDGQPERQSVSGLLVNFLHVGPFLQAEREFERWLEKAEIVKRLHISL